MNRRPVTLFTGQWADLPLEELAGKCAKWGFDGLELACWGDHFEVDRAVAEPGYVKAQRELLERHGLGCWAIGAHLVGQAVADPVKPFTCVTPNAAAARAVSFIRSAARSRTPSGSPSPQTSAGSMCS